VGLLVGLVVGKRGSRPWIVSDELWLLVDSLIDALQTASAKVARASP
jgi:hypothetical protein